VVTKVHRDRHGQFVRTGGHLFRPEPTRWSYPTRLAAWRDGSAFIDGEYVHAHHISQTSMAHVRSGDKQREARWWSHGVYLKPGGGYRSSAELWEGSDESNAQVAAGRAAGPDPA
jgi:hypothetical protein